MASSGKNQTGECSSFNEFLKRYYMPHVRSVGSPLKSSSPRKQKQDIAKKIRYFFPGLMCSRGLYDSKMMICFFTHGLHDCFRIFNISHGATCVFLLFGLFYSQQTVSGLAMENGGKIQKSLPCRDCPLR